VGKDNANALVVCKQGKYGLRSLDDGSLIADCKLDKIYAKYKDGERNYYVEVQGQEIDLDRYIEYINTTTVNVGQ